MRVISKEDYLKTFKNQTYVEQLQKVEREFKVYKNEEKGVTELTMYGVIGDSWWEDSISASDVDDALREVGDSDLIINLNSPGGDAFDGIAIYNRLKKHGGKVTINVDGWACSAASIIAMSADQLNMGMGSMIMIHEASSIVWGTKKDMRKESDVLENLEDGIIDIYMTKSNIDREDMRVMIDSETWFSAQKAVEVGFANSKETEDEKVTSLKSMVASLQSEIEQMKVIEEIVEEPVKQQGLANLFLNLK